MPAKKKVQRGKGIKEILSYIKDNKLLSKGLGIIPNGGAQVLSALAGMAGLGKAKKRRAPRKRVMRGTGIFSDLGGGIGSVFGGLGSGIGSVAHGLFGGGRRVMRPHRMAPRFV